MPEYDKNPQPEPDHLLSLSWITPSLAACAYPDSDEALAMLAAEGITVLVNLHTRAHPPGQLAAHGLREVHLPTKDFTPPSIEHVNEGISALDKVFAEGGRAAVHCGAGLGRTGTLIACYLVSTGIGSDRAIEIVRRARPGSVETSAQEALVHRYEALLRETGRE